jgi:hypothetical protein
MAIAGDSHNIPCFPISLGADGLVYVHTWATNKPREFVERDVDRAVERLLNGEMFEVHCSGPQVMRINAKLRERYERPDYANDYNRSA